MIRAIHGVIWVTLALTLLGACFGSRDPKSLPPRLVMFVGVDISGSFMKSRNYEDSIEFLSQYLYSHLNGLGGLEVPHSLFVGSIGGVKKDEPKTMFPIQTFQDSSPEAIRGKLQEIFPKGKVNPHTDFNAFFEQVADTVASRKLIQKPLSVVLFTDGKPDLGGKDKSEKFRRIRVAPLENLSRSVVLRVLYTDAVTAKSWQESVPRKRVKVWTQDAVVMNEWKHPKTFVPNTPIEAQERFFAWVKDNVDFQPRLRRVE